MNGNNSKNEILINIITRKNVTNIVMTIISGLEGGVDGMDICYATVQCTFLPAFQSGNSGE
jgi:hypothetical protein